MSLEEFGALLGRASGTSVKAKSGIVVTDDRALGLTAWYSGVRYLCESLASLPVHTFRKRNGAREQRSDPPWLTKPDVETPRFGLFEFAMYSLLHRGNFYAFKVRNALEQVIGLRMLHPDRVRAGQASDGTKVFEVDGNKKVGYTTREILHVPGLSKDGVFGVSPLRAHAESLGIIAAAEESASHFYGNASHPSAVIQLPQGLTEQEADELKEQWEKFHQGVKNKERIGILGGGAEYKTISLSAADTQLIEQRRYGVSEVARILRIPPHKLYELSRATFSNIEHQAIEAVVDSIRPWAVRLEAWMNFDPHLLPAGNHIEFELEGMLRGDTLTRYRSYAIGIQNGFLVANEPRGWENLPDIEGGDEPLRPLNLGSPTQTGQPDTTPQLQDEENRAQLLDEMRQIAAEEVARAGGQP